MNIRNRVRQFLRRYGRAAVVTVHERFDAVEQQSLEIANSHTALLQSNIHLLKAQAEQQTAHEAQLAALRECVDRLEKLNAALESQTYQVGEFPETVHQVTVETADYASTNPELGLMSFLYSYLPTNKAIDVGAHVGDVSEHLVHTGFEVFAFEPYPPSYTRLVERLSGRQRFRAFQIALGNTEGRVALHVASDSTDDGQFGDASVFNSLAPHSMPNGLAFDGSVSVDVRKLADLHSDGALPPDVSLVKIDTEGYDLEVIRGMDGQRYPVVVAEFWDTHIPFATEGLRYTVPTLVNEMRERGYDWYIVLYRVWGKNQTGFFCNHDRPVPDSWGNVFFFRDRDTFAAAQQWCSAALPRAYFKPASQPSRSSNTRVNGRSPSQ